MFKTKCPAKFNKDRMFPPEEDPVVMAKQQAVANTAAAIKNSAKITGNEEAS